MTIKHLVIPGGGPTGFQALGALRYLEESGFWSYDNIETIYSTSVGAIIGVLLCLRFDWDTIFDYVERRPWHDAVHVSVEQVFETYSKMGLFDQSLTKLFFQPFFDARDISIDMTLHELFNISNVELHIFTLELNSFEVCDLSHLTHPDLKVLTAIHMSASIPFIVTPVFIGDKCYVDGGIICNYPLKYCIDRSESIDDIFGIKNDYNVGSNSNITTESTILDYAVNFISKLVYTASEAYVPPEIPNELVYKTGLVNLTSLKLAINSQEKRKELLLLGKTDAELFLIKFKNKYAKQCDDVIEQCSKN